MTVIQVVVLFLSFLVFLFSIYTLSKDDFVFIRKNLSLEEMFSISILLIPGVLLFSRGFFILFHFKNIYLQPLVFLAILYYPGLSLLGAVVGAEVFSVWTCLAKKIVPIGRVCDIVSLSLFAVLSFIAYPYFLVISLPKTLMFIVHLLFTGIFISVFVLLVKFFLKEKFKDGSISLLFLAAFSFFSLLLEGILQPREFLGFLKGEGIMYVLVILVASIMFITREKLWIRLDNVFRKK